MATVLCKILKVPLYELDKALGFKVLRGRSLYDSSDIR